MTLSIVDMDGIKPQFSRRSSFEAATGQRRTSNTSSIDSTVQSELLANKQVTTGSNSSTEELSNHFDHLRFNDTPAFASSNMINEMLYRKKSNLSFQSPTPAMHRLDSNSSISSTSSLAQDRLRLPPPSYAESHFSRRDSSQRPLERRRGSAPLTYQNQGDRVEDKYYGHKNEALNNNVAPAAGLTKVRYVGGGGSPSQSDSDYNSDDVQVTSSPTRIVTSDYDQTSANHWVSTSVRNKSNIATERYNYPSKLGIMSNSESTGSYFVTETKPNARRNDKAHMYASTSALNKNQLLSGTISRSHHSSYAIHTPVLQKRQPLLNRFFNDGRGDWSGDDQTVESLV